MSRIVITPKKLRGTVEVPPSKSIAHRRIICAALSCGISRISHIEYSQDILATIDSMRALGTEIEILPDSLIVDGRKTFTKDIRNIDCRESGSTLRFMVPVSLVKQCNVSFKGSGKLGKRPLDIYYNIFDSQKIYYSYKKDELDLKINGKLSSGVFELAGNVSSQFISGLLFALPLLEGDSEIIITTQTESVGYIDLTLGMLKTFGIEVKNDNYSHFYIKGNQKYISHDYYVESDYSQAAFWLVSGALGNEVTLKGLNPRSLQGDRAVISFLEEMGCEIVKEQEGIRCIANSLHGITMDGRQCPDIIPVMAVCAALSEGHTEIINAERLRIKECDRLAASRHEISTVGGIIDEKPDGLSIDGVSGFTGGEIYDWNDHRITMMMAVASTRADGEIIINNPESVRKSYPSFWEDFIKLGGVYHEC